MKNLFLKASGILLFLCFLGGTAVAQEKTDQQEKKESKMVLKIIKNGETVLDSTFIPEGDMDPIKIKKLISQFGGEEVNLNWMGANSKQSMTMVKGGKAKTIKMKVLSESDKEGEVVICMDLNEEEECEGESECEKDCESSVMVWNSDKGHKMVFGPEGAKKGSIIIMTDEKNASKELDKVIELKEIEEEEPIKWMKADQVLIGKAPRQKGQIQMIPQESGAYRLEFNSEETDPIVVEVYNGEGKRLFKKKVRSFYGRFVKEMYLEYNETGFFTVRVVQGDKEIIGEFEFN